jgi:3-oxoacyl-[acyl-carrier-protein] synthase III
MSEVYITKTANFLPNAPISNDEMEQYLGQIGERASKSRRIVLRNNGIKQRYYALDKDGNYTHTNAEIAAQSIRKLMDNDPAKLKEIDLLTCGTSVPDQLMPSHGVMVHGELPESNAIEVITNSGNCCSGMHGLKFAYMSIKTGDAKKAVCNASERLSRSLHADQFELEAKKMEELEENPYIAFEKDFLRWMLSDGAASFLLEGEKSKDGISLRIDWIEGYSFANEIESCMYMGTEKLADGTMKSFKDYKQSEVQEQSIMSIKQDTKLLGENIVKLGFKKLEGAIKYKGMTADDITFFLPHMSSYFFESKIADTLDQLDMHIPKERWFSNLETTGNVGSVSIFLMVDELMNSGKLKVGDKILLAVPESARFSYVFSLLTVC